MHLDPNRLINIVINGNSAAPVAGIIAQKVEGKLFVHDEVYIMTSGNPLDAADAIADKYGGKEYRAQFDMVPDWRDGKANHTDGIATYNRLNPHFLGLQDMSYYAGLDHREVDSINSLLALFSCTKDNCRLFISDRCKSLLRDLDQCVYMPGTRKVSREDKALYHVSSCLQILALRMFPVQRLDPTKPPERKRSDLGEIFYAQRMKNQYGEPL